MAEETLLHHSAQISEHAIAAHVFERDSNFDPVVDTIVRSHMVRLRQKLDRFAEDGERSPSIRVSIPKGEYSVRFDKLAPAAVQETLETTHSPQGPPRTGFRWAQALIISNCLFAILFLGSAILLYRQIHHPASSQLASSPSRHPLWSRIFQTSERTTFVAADGGLVLLHRMTAKGTTLAEYLSRDFSQETGELSTERKAEVLDMADRRYTSFVDLNLFHGLEQLPVASARLELKYARDLHVDDLKHGNFVFSGARGANPWLELYEAGMNFVGTSTGNGENRSYSFINRHPLSGEQSEYAVTEKGSNRRILGVLAFLSNLDGNGNVLIVEGDSMAGTEAISDFVLDDSALLPFLKKLTQQDGTLPHFEVLLEARSVNGSAGPFRILAYRTHL